jgi:hypothetical protein
MAHRAPVDGLLSSVCRSGALIRSMTCSPSASGRLTPSDVTAFRQTEAPASATKLTNDHDLFGPCVSAGLTRTVMLSTGPYLENSPVERQPCQMERATTTKRAAHVSTSPRPPASQESHPPTEFASAACCPNCRQPQSSRQAGSAAAPPLQRAPQSLTGRNLPKQRY